MSGKKKKQQRDLLSFWAVEGQPPPAKLARSEETVEEALDLSVNDRAEENESPEGTENETAEETEDDDVEEIEAPEDTEDETEERAEETVEMRVETGKKQSAKSGAATYRCTFKREWTAEWPFITLGTTSYYWCSICRHENSCAHQGKADVIRHIKSKGHRAKEQAIQSTTTIAPYYAQSLLVA
ncbi:Vacuolar membrane protease [Dissostichus eleginoides]|uniref:Vacuolar membrane protease n=1 Tax=Dissostichus eleginoides TaxID=100907 RepID=A0AAD9F8Z7_DISEL|nr:Vacuolar membrane protease [Dissostichus eleginoides]